MLNDLNKKYPFNDELNINLKSVSYTHLRAHETVLDLVCRLLLEKKTQQKHKKKKNKKTHKQQNKHNRTTDKYVAQL